MAPASIGQVIVSPGRGTCSVIAARPCTKGLVCRYNPLFRYANVTSTVKMPLLQEESKPKKTEDIFSTPVVKNLQYIVPEGYYIIRCIPSVVSHFSPHCHSLIWVQLFPYSWLRAPCSARFATQTVQQSSKPTCWHHIVRYRRDFGTVQSLPLN